MKSDLNIKWIYGLIIGMVVFSGCKKKTETDLDPQTSYFGLQEGAYVDYDVTYMFHDSLLQKHDTIRYQIRTVVAETMTDNSGRTVRKFYRYRRTNANGEWKVKDLWTAVIDGNKAELVEENQRTVKLVFRPVEGKEWDMNAFNNLGKTIAHYSMVGGATQVGTLNFPTSLKVSQDYYKTLIDLRDKYELYAPGVGMIQKVSRDLHYKFGSPAPIKGEEYFYNVVDYGVL